MDVWYKQRLEFAMWEWAYEHIVLPALGALIENVPWYVWVAVAALLFALVYKLYKFLGWPGVLGAALAVLTFGAYRQGWLNAVRRHDADKFTPEDERISRPTIFSPRKRTKKAKRRFNADTNLWEEVGGTGNPRN